MKAVRILISLIAIGLIAVSCSQNSSPLSTITEPSGELEDAAVPLWARAGNVDAYNAEIAVAWFQLANELVKAEALSPPVAARAFGYAGVVLYESVVPGMPHHSTLAGQLNKMPSIPTLGSVGSHWPAAANSALRQALHDLLESGSPATLDAIEELYNDFNSRFETKLPRDVLELSNQRGVLVAKTIVEWAQQDGAAEMGNCNYTPTVGSEFWIPTPPGYAPALLPCWGEVRPFVMQSAYLCDPGAPPAYSEDPVSTFYIEGQEVYDAVANLTPEQLIIAQFWADNPGQTATPPGHSISILSQVLVQEGHGLDVAAEAYARVGMAVADAFIACWWSKYEYELCRPITFIHKMFDPAWESPVGTPPFPEYTSGHSVQSGAAAQVMTDMFGRVTFTDHTHDELGMTPRPFNSFFEFADEAAISRLYGGIHFRSAIDLGVEQGKCVGRQVSALKFRKSGWAHDRALADSR